MARAAPGLEDKGERDKEKCVCVCGGGSIRRDDSENNSLSPVTKVADRQSGGEMNNRGEGTKDEWKKGR